MADKILVHRAMALGDVILTTPIVRALFNDGDCEIDVSSNYPIVFKDNPYIKQALHPSQVNAADYDQIYNLDLNINILYFLFQFMWIVIWASFI